MLQGAERRKKGPQSSEHRRFATVAPKDMGGEREKTRRRNENRRRSPASRRKTHAGRERHQRKQRIGNYEACFDDIGSRRVSGERGVSQPPALTGKTTGDGRPIAQSAENTSGKLGAGTGWSCEASDRRISKGVSMRIGKHQGTECLSPTFFGAGFRRGGFIPISMIIAGRTDM